MKKKWLIGLLVILSGFILLFIIRFIYGFVSFPNYNENQEQIYFQSNINQQQNLDYTRKNYASFKQVNSKDSIIIDQKYEKKAILNSYTNNFTEDEKKIRSVIESNKALIQYENQTGLEGKRQIYLSIGVPPVNFDKMVEEIKKIGRLNNIQINKNDKTNEYKEIKVKIESLVKSRDALLKLKNMQAKVEELVKLEEKILELENQIQDLGVNMGQFDEENEFCTIDFTLIENIFKGKKISIFHRIIVALEWSVKYYFIFIITLFFGMLLLLTVFKLLEKFKVFKIILDKLNKK